MVMKRTQTGFTLIELMVVVAVIAIITAIAYPSYQNSIRRTHRIAASGCMLELGQFMERFYSTNMMYTNAVLPITPCQNELANFYQFQFNAAPAANTYSLNAVPIGSQAADTCGVLNVDQAGTRTPNLPECWR